MGSSPVAVNLSSAILSKPLCDAINNNLLPRIFPDEAKVVFVSPVDKASLNKNKISNYRPVGVLNCF